MTAPKPSPGPSPAGIRRALAPKPLPVEPLNDTPEEAAKMRFLARMTEAAA